MDSGNLDVSLSEATVKSESSVSSVSSESSESSVSSESSESTMVSEQTAESLSTLLLSNIHTPSYHFTQEQLNWIKQFITSSPDSFKQLTTDIQAIIEGGQIGLQSIPKIIHLCADIYNNAALKNGLSNPANILLFIRFTLDTMLSSKYLPLPEIEKELIQQLVDTSLNLLEINLVPMENEIQELDSCCHAIFRWI
jgi:hypothetical protein